jgi:integrase
VFYDWAFDNGHIARSIVNREQRNTSAGGLLRHLSVRHQFARPRVLPHVPRRRRYPQYYNAEEQRAFYEHLNERNGLMVDWALYTGAREFEICALTVDQIPAPSVYRARNVYQLPLHITKGDVPANIWVPAWLLTKTYQYIRFFGRCDIERHAKKRGSHVTQHVFLSRWGRPMRPDSLYRAFRKALNAAGLKGTFHALRHTYAISMLHKLMQLPPYQGSDGVNAILELKHLLRHSSLETTMVYLEARKFYLTSSFSNLFELPGGVNK